MKFVNRYAQLAQSTTLFVISIKCQYENKSGLINFDISVIITLALFKIFSFVKNLGEILKNRRNSKGISLTQASEDTKISAKILKSIEESNYDQFISDVYLRGFIKNYSKYLELDESKSLAILRRERGEIPEKNIEKSTTSLSTQKFLLTPGKIIFSLISITVLIVLVFIFIQINKVIKPPELSLEQPVLSIAPDEIVYETNENTITISGKVDAGSEIFINGNKVTTNNLEEYRVDSYKLENGNNIIDIKAENQFLKTNQITLTVIADFETDNTNQDSQEEDTSSLSEEVKIIEELNILLKVNDAAWLEVTIDDQPELTQVVSPGDIYEFKANESISIYTPRPQTVELIINDEERKIETTETHIWKLVEGEIIEQKL